MTELRSLRTRLIFGSLWWGASVLAIATIGATLVVRLRPAWTAVIHNGMLTLFAFFCAAAGFAQIRRGLSPFNTLRTRLGAVREGKDRRIAGDYPSEVQPLVNDLNALLEDRERSIARAQAKAGDLAHGLKTPLAVLAQEAERAEAAGHQDLAKTIGEQVARMRRQIEYHLAHARAAASGAALGVRCPVAVSVDGLVRTLERLYADRNLTIDVDVPADHAVRAEREDLDEMLGNLLDNACKWAAARVTIRSTADGPQIAITIDDDGQGLDRSMREHVLQRGVRADETSPGSGLGLAIAGDLAALYGGAIELDQSSMGGLRARLRLPQ